MEGGTVGEFPMHLLAVDRDFMHLALIHVGHKLREVDVCILLPVAPLLNHGPQHKGRHPDPHPEQHGFYCRIHQEAPEETRIPLLHRRPRGSHFRLDAVRPISIGKFPNTVILHFPKEKRAPHFA